MMHFLNCPLLDPGENQLGLTRKKGTMEGNRGSRGGRKRAVGDGENEKDPEELVERKGKGK